VVSAKLGYALGVGSKNNQKKDRLGSAGGIATHAVGKSSDNVENATDIATGDVAGGTGRIGKNSIDIATHRIA